MVETLKTQFPCATVSVSSETNGTPLEKIPARNGPENGSTLSWGWFQIQKKINIIWFAFSFLGDFGLENSGAVFVFVCWS